MPGRTTIIVDVGDKIKIALFNASGQMIKNDGTPMLEQ